MGRESDFAIANPESPIPVHKRKAPHEAGPSQNRSRWRSARDDVDRFARFGALDLELDRAIDQGEQRVVAAEADARARMEARAALADDDVAGFDRLATIDLHAEVLRVRVATVAG